METAERTEGHKQTCAKRWKKAQARINRRRYWWPNAEHKTQHFLVPAHNALSPSCPHRCRVSSTWSSSPISSIRSRIAEPPTCRRTILSS